jgi:hypothetical protein
MHYSAAGSGQDELGKYPSKSVTSILKFVAEAYKFSTISLPGTRSLNPFSVGEEANVVVLLVGCPTGTRAGRFSIG